MMKWLMVVAAISVVVMDRAICGTVARWTTRDGGSCTPLVVAGNVARWLVGAESVR